MTLVRGQPHHRAKPAYLDIEEYRLPEAGDEYILLTTDRLFKNRTRNDDLYEDMADVAYYILEKLEEMELRPDALTLYATLDHYNRVILASPDTEGLRILEVNLRDGGPIEYVKGEEKYSIGLWDPPRGDYQRTIFRAQVKGLDLEDDGTRLPNRFLEQLDQAGGYLLHFDVAEPPLCKTAGNGSFKVVALSESRIVFEFLLKSDRTALKWSAFKGSGIEVQQLKYRNRRNR